MAEGGEVQKLSDTQIIKDLGKHGPLRLQSVDFSRDSVVEGGFAETTDNWRS